MSSPTRAGNEASNPSPGSVSESVRLPRTVHGARPAAGAPELLEDLENLEP
ncbi:hypothetical protein [Millisia brevis]|uniref:hypothetical protein n=1 Tax=Millisia brevis TaxID=264148 RepID=UPI001470ABB8|nr:hypothetical protein [Millisia brevis]